MTQVLRDACLHVKEVSKSQAAPISAAGPTNAASSAAAAGSCASANALAGQGVKDAGKESEQVPPPPPLASEDIRSGGKEKVGGELFRLGLLASQEVGIVLISRELTIMDANPTFLNFVLGVPGALAVEVAEDLSTKVAKAVGAGDVPAARHTTHAVRSPEQTSVVGADIDNKDQIVGAKRKEPSDVHKSAQPRGKEDVSAEEIVADEAALGVCNHSLGRVFGQSLRHFLHKNDERQLLLATKHVTEEAFDEERLRKCVLGLRFQAQPLDTENQRMAQSRHDVLEYENIVPQDESTGSRRSHMIMRPVELVPCAHNLYGSVFILFVFPLAEDNRPDMVFRAMELLGPVLEPAHSFNPVELANEIDKNSDFKLGWNDAIRNPLVAAVAVAGHGPEAVAAFERQAIAHDEALGKMMAEVRACLPTCLPNTGSGGMSFSNIVLQAAQHVTACGKIRLMLVRGDKHLRLRLVMGRCVIWELEAFEQHGSVVLAPLLVEGGGGVDSNTLLHDKSECKHAARGEVEVRTEVGGRRVRQPVGRVALLRTGELWFYFEDAVELPMSCGTPMPALSSGLLLLHFP